MTTDINQHHDKTPCSVRSSTLWTQVSSTTGFHHVSQSPSRSLCSCASVSMVLLLHTYRNSVSRSKTSEGIHGYGLHLLDVFSYQGWGRQRDSEVLRSMGRQFGTARLPSTLRDSSLSLRAFKTRLKTYLFGRGQ